MGQTGFFTRLSRRKGGIRQESAGENVVKGGGAINLENFLLRLLGDSQVEEREERWLRRQMGGGRGRHYDRGISTPPPPPPEASSLSS